MNVTVQDSNWQSTYYYKLVLAGSTEEHDPSHHLDKYIIICISQLFDNNVVISYHHTRKKTVVFKLNGAI